jgi:mono/diheme cytochrome c family protein
LLLVNKNEDLAKFTKFVRIPEMIVSTLFLITGIYMLTQIPEVKSFMIVKIVLVFASIPLAVIGYKKRNKLLALLSLLLIFAAYGLAEMSKKQKSAVPAESTETSAAISGHDIFTANCVKCHGEDGKLGLMDSPDLSVSTLDLNSKMEIIKNGKNAMTPFAGILTDDQIKAVTEYTETLKK